MTHSPDQPYKTVSQLSQEYGPSSIPVPEIPDDILHTFEEAYEGSPAISSPETGSGNLGAAAIKLEHQALAETQDPAA